MNRLFSGLKQNLVQFAFDQCVPGGTDLTFCFNYNEPKKLRLKSIQYYSGGSKCSTTTSSINNVQDAKKFKIDVSQSDAATSTKYDKLKYSKVTIRIGRNVSNRSFNNHNKHFIKQKQLSKFNSNLKVIMIILVSIILELLSHKAIKSFFLWCPCSKTNKYILIQLYYIEQ